MDSRISEFLRAPWVIPTAVGVGSFGAGFAAGYFVKKRQDSVTYYNVDASQLSFEFGATTADVERAKLEFDTDVESSGGGEPERREPLEGISTADPKPDPSTITVDEDALAALESPDEADEEDPVDTVTTTNVFAGALEGWDYDVELAQRKSDAPYVIHKDEFFADEMGYDQQTLTYYDGDDILADEQQTPVYGHERLVGELKFGHGSGDPNVVYVRNEQRQAEYEILFDPGAFSREVLGIGIEEEAEEAELRHSRALTKFRME